MVEVENCGVRHAPDVDAEMGWRVASVDRDATIFCRGENFMAGVGMGQEGVIWKGGEAQFNLRGGGGEYSSRLHIIGLPLRSMRCVVPALALHQTRARA